MDGGFGGGGSAGYYEGGGGGGYSGGNVNESFALNQAVAGRTFPVTMETPGTRRHEHEKKEMVTLLFALTVPDWLKLIVECKRDQ